MGVQATNPPTAVASAVPTNKAVAATGAAAIGAPIATIVLFVLDHDGKLPAEMKVAVTGLVTATVTLIAAYYTPPGAAETIVRAPDGAIKSAKVAS